MLAASRGGSSVKRLQYGKIRNNKSTCTRYTCEVIPEKLGEDMPTGKLTLLPIDSVELDRTNARIRRFLDNYQGEPTYDQIALALDVAGSGDDSQGATPPEKLKNSILTNGGVMQPIIVHKRKDGTL